MATNELGHQLARSVGDETTLGAYRRGRRLPWVTGATIDAWVSCARGEIATGVPQPHVYFVQTIGGAGAESGSIYCPSCRSDLAARRTGTAGPSPSLPPPPRAAVLPSPPSLDQGDLPF